MKPLILVHGVMGAGKSEVMAIWKSYNAEYCFLAADQIVHTLYKQDTALQEAMANCFGKDVLSGTDGIDRAVLLGLLEKDRAQIAALNALVHPKVRTFVAKMRAEAAPSCKAVVLELPLVTKENNVQFDLCVGVVAHEEALRKRLQRRWGSYDKAKWMVFEQSKNTMPRQKWTYTVYNTRNRDYLWREVMRLDQKVRLRLRGFYSAYKTDPMQ